MFPINCYHQLTFYYHLEFGIFSLTFIIYTKRTLRTLFSDFSQKHFLLTVKLMLNLMRIMAHFLKYPFSRNFKLKVLNRYWSCVHKSYKFRFYVLCTPQKTPLPPYLNPLSKCQRLRWIWPWFWFYLFFTVLAAKLQEKCEFWWIQRKFWTFRSNLKILEWF